MLRRRENWRKTAYNFPDVPLEICHWGRPYLNWLVVSTHLKSVFVSWEETNENPSH
jgi:hypothetical protein